MALGAAYGGSAVASMQGVPKIAQKSGGGFAVFKNLAELKAYYADKEKPESGFAAVVGIVRQPGSEIGRIDAAYTWDDFSNSWEAVLNNLAGADGGSGKSAGAMRGEWDKKETYDANEMVRWIDPDGDNRVGLYQCLHGSVNSRPDTTSDWVLVFEETAIQKVHGVFKFSLVNEDVVAQSIDTALNKFAVAWNIDSIAQRGEKVTEVRVRFSNGHAVKATARQLKAQKVIFSQDIVKPEFSNKLDITVTAITNKGNISDQRFSITWDTTTYYGFSSQAELSDVSELDQIVLNSASPDQVSVERHKATAKYMYLVLPNSAELPTAYAVSGIEFLLRKGVLEVSGYEYVVFRSKSKTVLTAVDLVAA